MQHQAQHARRELTPAEKARVLETRRWAQQHATEIRQLARIHRDHPGGAVAGLQDALDLLKVERLRQQLNLSDNHERTDSERSELLRLEREAEANPTVSALRQFAEALGKQLLVVLDDLPT